MIRSREMAFGNERSFLQVDERDAFIDILPLELIIELFSRLHFYDLLKISTVNKKFSVLANNPEILSHVIYRDMTFNPDDWRFYFGDQSPGANDGDLAIDLLPKNIGAIFKSKFLKSAKKKLGETHAIVWKPGDLSIKNYHELIETKCDLAVSIMSNLKSVENNVTEKGEWIFMARRVLSGTYAHEVSITEKQIKKLKLKQFKSCNVPTVLEAFVTAISIYLKYDTKLFFGNGKTMCQEISPWSSTPICICNGFELVIGSYFRHKAGVSPVWKL